MENINIETCNQAETKSFEFGQTKLLELYVFPFLILWNKEFSCTLENSAMCSDKFIITENFGILIIAMAVSDTTENIWFCSSCFIANTLDTFTNLVYRIECSLCWLIYVGEMNGQWNSRMNGNGFDVNNGSNKMLYRYFNSHDHSNIPMKIRIPK